MLSYFFRNLLAFLLILIAAPGSWAPSAWAGHSDHISLVRNIDTGTLGYPSPSGLAFSNAAETFFILETPPTPLPLSSDIIVINGVGEFVASLSIAAGIQDPVNMAFDNNANRLLIYQPATTELIEIAADAFGVLQPATLTSINVSQFGLLDPQGMTVAQNGDLYVLDGVGPRIVRLVPDPVLGFAQAAISDVSLAGKGLDGVRGIALDPATGHFHMLDPIGQLLYEVTDAGQIVVSRDASTFNLLNPRSMVFAPSGDLTDDPSVMNLYIADNGDVSGSGTPGNIAEMSLTAPVSMLSTFTSTLIRTIDSSGFSPSSPDTAGAAYISSGFYSGTIMLSDSEVNEIPSLFTGDNLFNITLDGLLLDTLTTLGFSNEPTGMAFNPSNQHLFLTDDDAKKVNELDPGSDGQFNTADDIVTSFDTDAFGSFDPEGITFDPVQGFLYIVDGVNNEVYEIDPGPNLIFDGVPPAGDDVVSSFDVSAFGVVDPEGITFDTKSHLLYVVGRSTEGLIVLLTTGGALVQNLDISAANALKPSGLAFGPSSVDPAMNSIYLTDRGVDNNTDPNENDGRVYELSAPLPVTPGNTPPTVNAGPDQAIILPAVAVLDGTVTDDGIAQATPTISWSQVSGPGTVTFVNAGVEDTTASFSVSGTYVLRLMAFDGELISFDELTVVVSNEGETTLNIRVSAGSDDAEESAGGSMSLTSSDLELVFDGSDQTVGMRFLGVNIPKGATITSAYVQFQVDEAPSNPASLTIQGEKSDNAFTFTSSAGNITLRPLTTASVPWSPAPWNTVGAAGPDQRTPDIASVIQEIVNLPGWANGNPLAVIITGTGERVAESFNGDSAGAPLLHVVFLPTPPVTVPNVVGLAQASAEAAITGAGLVVGTVTTQSSTTVPAGNVISQNPVGGSSVPSGSTVNLAVSSGPPVTVPDVVGLAQANAEAAITGVGLVVGTVITQSSTTVLAGNVISQNPVGGASVAPGSAVNLVVSSGPAPVTVPDVVGLTQASAETAITGAGLLVETVTAQSSTTVPAGDVISQNPIGGTMALEGSAVNLAVSSGPAPVTVPSVVGQTQANAEAAIVGAGLVVGTVTAQSSTTVPAGDVISQSPVGGTSAAPGSAVNLAVSSGPPVTVPDVVGQTQASAEAAITGVGLVVGTVTTQGSATVPAGDVISQNPVGGASVAPGSAVNLAVSSGAAPVTLDIRVSASSDDAEERTGGSMALNSSDLEMVTDGSRQQTIGLRFNGVTIPNGATITNATIQFQVDEANSEATSLNIQGEKSDNALTFTSTSGNITFRPLTTASVPWAPVPWNTVGAAGADQRTPDISAAIQEIVNMPGWASGNSLAVIIDGAGKRVAEAFDGVPSAAPLLHVEFSTTPDLDPPSIPTGLTATAISSSRINLTWNASTDNVAVSGYDIFRCPGLVCVPGTLVGSSSTTSYTDINLSASTGYTYTVVAFDNSGNISDPSLPVSETTLDPGQFAQFTLVGAGDIADDGSPTGSAEATAQLIDNIVAIDPDATVFTAGDNAYQDGTTADFLQNYDPTWGRHRSQTFPSPGNHDYHVTGAVDYLDYFCPTPSDCVFPGNMQELYYSYDLGNWHIVSLNSEKDTEAGSAQVEWLKQDLAAHPGSCILAYWHHPYYSSGSLGSSSLPSELWKELYLAGADVVVSGHDHTYERFAKQDLYSNVDPNGIRAFVVGTGGAGLFSFSSPIANSEVRYNTSYGVIKFTLRDSGYDWEFIPEAGFTFTDTGSEACNTGGNPNTAPAVNAGLDQTIQFPADATLDGTVTDDSLLQQTPTITWSQESGPGTATFANPNIEDTTASFSTFGTYVLRLTAFDGEFTIFDELTVTVDPPVNGPPTVNAGLDQSINLPLGAVLDGTVTDDGLVQATPTLTWSQQSGPGTAAFVNANLEDTTASFSAEGTYVLRLTAFDGQFTVFDELTIIVGPVINTAPAVNAGPDQTILFPGDATLNGTVTDDGLVQAAPTITWSRESGPLGGTVTFVNANVEDTTAGFSALGTYVLRLTAFDGEFTVFDELTIEVTDVVETTIDIRVSSSSDDAEESAGGSMDLGSSDLELVFDGGGNQTVGMRFNGLNIPACSTITNATIQFQVDEAPSAATSLTIQGERTASALTFTTTNGNITSRPLTTASVPWAPVGWPTVGAAGLDQRTPNISSVIQEIVNLPGWLSGNSLAVIISGTGERVAEAFNGVPSAAPLLHVVFFPNACP